MHNEKIKRNFVCVFFFCLTEISGPAFEEFLDLLGSRVSLKGFEGYRAQLDNRSKYCNVYLLLLL